jgi:PAS domain S-box-containing protein
MKEKKAHLKIPAEIGLDLSMPFTTLNNENFHALFNYASIGILITNAGGEILMANKYVQHQFGYKEEELIGCNIEVLIPPRYAGRHVGHRDKFNANPHSRPMGLGMELWGLRKDKTEFPAEVSLGHYKIGSESYSLAFVNDITQRKETEQAIVNLNAHLEQKVKEGTQSLAITVDQLGRQIKETDRKDAELERVNTFLNNIWNHAGAIIFVTDQDGLLQFFNPAAEMWLGYNSGEVIGRLNVTHFHTREELVQKAAEYSNLTGRNVKPDFDIFSVAAAAGLHNNQEWHYVKKDGSTFFISLNITQLKDSYHNVSGYLGIAIDISEKKKAETDLWAAFEKEKELNELKSRFVSMASHEFRTPLSAILSSAYLLSRYEKTEEQPQREKHIQRIVASVTSLTEILNDFLSVGKIEEGKAEVNYRDYDLSEQVHEIIQDVQHLLKKNQSIAYHEKGMPTTVRLDSAMMKHIITNLLSNAIKFSNESSVIDVTARYSDNDFSLSVQDHGIGIPEEDLDNLFKRFFRSSNVTNIQGTGLGLHIVAKYTDLMNGKIACDSTLGRGTTFTITFSHS